MERNSPVVCKSRQPLVGSESTICVDENSFSSTTQNDHQNRKLFYFSRGVPWNEFPPAWITRSRSVLGSGKTGLQMPARVDRHSALSSVSIVKPCRSLRGRE